MKNAYKLLKINPGKVLIFDVYRGYEFTTALGQLCIWFDRSFDYQFTLKLSKERLNHSSSIMLLIAINLMIEMFIPILNLEVVIIIHLVWHDVKHWS
jgi:uncharacterized Tic20 family protein